MAPSDRQIEGHVFSTEEKTARRRTDQQQHHEPGGKLIHLTRTKFYLGQFLATPGAIKVMAEAGDDPLTFLRRHASGDWGDVCDEDKRLNDQSLDDGSRILSTYHTSLGEKLWIITEAEDDRGRRAATTILLPIEY